MASGARARGPLRIAQVLPGLAGGGMERMATDLSQSLAARGHRVELFWGSYPGLYADRLRGAGIAVHDCRPGRFRVPGLPVRLVRALRRFGPDVIHAHSGIWYPSTIGAALLGRALVFTDHGRYPPEPWIDHFVQRFQAMRTDALIVVSEPLAAYDQEHLRLARRPRVVRNGIDLTKYGGAATARRDELRAEWGLPSTAVVAAMLGRLEPVKNVEGMLDALATADASLCLVLLGSGTLEESLRARTASLGLAHRVRFLGFREDVPACLAAADLLAMPSHTEGLPIALLEGLAAGLPVVASAVGGIPDALGDPPAGRLVPVGDTRALGLALNELARDPALRRRLGTRAVERAQAFGIDAMTSEYEAVYQECVAKRP